MATVITLPVVAPPLPASWVQKQADAGFNLSPEASSTLTTNLSSSDLVPRTLLPVGQAFLGHVRRSIHNHSFEEHDKHEQERRERRAKSEEADGIEDDLGVGDEEESKDLLMLDPKEWKKQDHYAVLGLSHLRYKATQDQIKIAHRKKVLKHHPDKKAGAVGNANDDAFFKCIQKAFEILSHPEKRRQFDSVDPELTELEEDEKPEELKRKLGKNPDNTFFEVFAPIIEREARFSSVQPVPLLGGKDDPKDSVNGFYNFWYNFDSWRSFEYLDKEVNEGSDNRDDKRYTEKKNKSNRQQRKKDDNKRLRTLIDTALAIDPRIKRIKQEEKEAREAKKRKGNPKLEEAEKKKREEEEMKKQAEEKEAKDREEKAALKKAKEKAANDAKKARRAAKKAQEDAAAAAS